MLGIGLSKAQLQAAGGTVRTGHLFEHSHHARTPFGVGTTARASTFTHAARTTRDLGNLDFIEFRHPHHRKDDFFEMFRPGHDEPVSMTVPQYYYLTSGKLKTHQKPLFKGGDFLQSKDAMDAGLEVGGALAGLIGATGASVAVGAVTLGGGAAVVSAYLVGKAVQRHVQNLRRQQVFVRISRAPDVAFMRWAEHEKDYKTSIIYSSQIPLTWLNVASWVRGNMSAR